MTRRDTRQIESTLASLSGLEPSHMIWCLRFPAA